MGNINLVAILTARLNSYPSHEAAAKDLKISVAQVGKFFVNSSLPIVAIQHILSDLEREGRLHLLDAPGRPPKVKEEPEEEKPKMALAVMEPTRPPVDLEELIEVTLSRMPDMDPQQRALIYSKASDLSRRKIVLAIPCVASRDIPPIQLLTILGNSRNLCAARVMVEQEETVDESRNLLMQRFLVDSDAQWIVMMAPDVMAPFGNPGWMAHFGGAKAVPAEFSGIRSLDRLTADSGRGIVGGWYAANGSKKLAIPHQYDETEAGKEIVDLLLSKGPSNRLIQSEWVAGGLIAIHRKVLEDIARTQKSPSEKPGGPFPYFAPVAGPFGSERRFCGMAKKAGHASYLDLAVLGARIVRIANIPHE